MSNFTFPAFVTPVLGPTGLFEPIWQRWFTDLVNQLNALNGSSVTGASVATGNCSDLVGTPTFTYQYSIVGSFALIELPTITGTSNAATFTLNNMPFIRGISGAAGGLFLGTDNGVVVTDVTATHITNLALHASSISLHRGSAGAWNNAGTKAINACSLMYRIA